MFVRMFLYADTKEEALRISDDVLRNLDARIDRKTVVESEPYWKMEGVYQIGTALRLKQSVISKAVMRMFLKSLSNIWLTYGEPVDEFLVTRNLEHAVLTNEKVEMVLIFIEDEIIEGIADLTT